MRDKRPVDELSIEELERVLAIKRREARRAQLTRMQREGRVAQPQPTPPQRQPPPAEMPPGLAIDEEGVVLVNAAEAHSAAPPPAPRREAKSAPPPVRGGGSYGGTYFEDEVHDVDINARRRDEADRAWRRFVNTALLLVETAAVIGLLTMAVLLVQARDEFRSDSNRLQDDANATRVAGIPTLEPTAILRADINDFLLPGGHTFENGQPVRNTAELAAARIPAHLLPEVQQQLTAPVIERPQRTPETALFINIPRLNLEQTIVQGADWEALKQGVGQVINGARPGDQTGNVVLAAHNDIYGELFRELDQLQPGDQFTVRTESNVYTYVVTGTDIVEPTAVEVMANQGLPTATLISCYPYGVNTHRYIVFAERLDT